MSLQTNNKIVVEFYKKNKHISFEEVNVFMVDMLEKMMKQALKNDDEYYNDYDIIPATAVDSDTAGGSKKGRNKTLKKRNKK